MHYTLNVICVLHSPHLATQRNIYYSGPKSRLVFISSAGVRSRAMQDNIKCDKWLQLIPFLLSINNILRSQQNKKIKLAQAQNGIPGHQSSL